jgi:hypothetical protein
MKRKLFRAMCHTERAPHDPPLPTGFLLVGDSDFGVRCVCGRGEGCAGDEEGGSGVRGGAGGARRGGGHGLVLMVAAAP